MVLCILLKQISACERKLVTGTFDVSVLLSVAKQALRWWYMLRVPCRNKAWNFTFSYSTHFLATDGHARGFNRCIGSAEDSVAAATNAAEETRQRLLKTEGQAVTNSVLTSATAAASTTAAHQTATTAANSGGKPPKAPRPTGGTQDSAASSSGQAGGAGQQKGSVGQGQDGSAGAAGQGPPDGNDDPYRPMGWQVSLKKSRTPAWHRLLLRVHQNRALGIMHYSGISQETDYGAKRSAFPLSLSRQVKDLRKLECCCCCLLI